METPFEIWDLMLTLITVIIGVGGAVIWHSEKRISDVNRRIDDLNRRISEQNERLRGLEQNLMNQDTPAPRIPDTVKNSKPVEAGKHESAVTNASSGPGKGDE